MSINSACVYLNTPIGGVGVRHTGFCITLTNTKITSIIDCINNQTIPPSNTCQSNHPPTPNTTTPV